MESAALFFVEISTRKGIEEFSSTCSVVHREWKRFRFEWKTNHLYAIMNASKCGGSNYAHLLANDRNARGEIKI